MILLEAPRGYCSPSNCWAAVAVVGCQTAGVPSAVPYTRSTRHLYDMGTSLVDSVCLPLLISLMTILQGFLDIKGITNHCIMN